MIGTDEDGVEEGMRTAGQPTVCSTRPARKCELPGGTSQSSLIPMPYVCGCPRLSPYAPITLYTRTALVQELDSS